MAQNLFGSPIPEDETMQIDSSPGDIYQSTELRNISAHGGISHLSSSGNSEPMHIEWEQTFVDFNEDDEDFELYSRMLANDYAAIAPDSEEFLGQGQQIRASWQVRPSTWGPGINGETIPNALLPLYTNIPNCFQTFDYWRQLVDNARANSLLTPRIWVTQMVRILAQPTTLPDAIFGWTQLSREWRVFFLTDRSLFTTSNMTPELWISMVNNLHTSTPEIWRRELPPPIALFQPVERGDPTNYISQYVPTINTGAPMLTINPRACGPIPKDFDFTKRKFAGRLATNPHFWGDFFDDGPRKEDEEEGQATLRIKWARANMGIIRRPTEKLPLVQKTLDISRDKQVQKERNILRVALSNSNSRRGRTHAQKMDEKHPSFDPAYRDRWRKQQKDRRAENNRRRHAAYEHAARHYRHMGLPDPPKPAPPEDSDDDYFFDPLDPMIPNLLHVDENRTTEPYRCKPCVDERAKCNYKTQRFPCRRCVDLGRENECVSSRPDLIQRAESRVVQKAQTGEEGRINYSFVRPEGPFIPSFSLPPERLEHSAIPARLSPPSPKPLEESIGVPGGRVFQLLEAKGPPLLFEEAVNAVKRTIPGVETVDSEGPKRKKSKPTGKTDETSGRKKAPSTEASKKTPARRAKRSRGQKKDGKDERFEPCDQCKAIGHIDWCDRGRPCQNCVLNDRADRCDASRQSQPYTTNPGGVEGNGDFDVLDDPFNNSVYVSQQMANLPRQSRPPPSLDPDEAAPYSYLQEDIAQLYETRSHLGNLPVRRPDNPEDILRAFIYQDRSLRQADADYRPLTLVQNVEAYAIQLLTAMIDEPPQAQLTRPEASDPTFTEALWQGGHVTMPSPKVSVTEADVLRIQAQQPHSPWQSMQNFGLGLAIRQTNRHEQLPEHSPITDEGIDWLMDESPTTDYYSSLHPSYNAQSFDATFDSIFRDVEPHINPALLELDAPTVTPRAQVTTKGIASALHSSSQVVYPITWYLGSLRAGCNVANEIANTDRETTHCTEDLNFWNSGTTQVVPCPSLNGIACDAWTCTGSASCPNCWDRQKAAAPSMEMRTVANTKAWFCESCKAALDQERLRSNSAQPTLNRCYCVAQLQETRLCNVDRVAAREVIAQKAAEEAANMAAMGWTGRCGQCWSNVEDATTGAWRCICCSEVATLP